MLGYGRGRGKSIPIWEGGSVSQGVPYDVGRSANVRAGARGKDGEVAWTIDRGETVRWGPSWKVEGLTPRHGCWRHFCAKSLCFYVQYVRAEDYICSRWRIMHIVTGPT